MEHISASSKMNAMDMDNPEEHDSMSTAPRKARLAPEATRMLIGEEFFRPSEN
jgi:hypothetical protein